VPESGIEAGSPAAPALSGDPDARSILRSSGPRVVRDTFGPLLTFYAGWKLIGLVAGIAAATVVAVALVTYERRRGRPGSIARLALGIVLIRAVVGLLTGSAKLYLAQDVATDVLLGTAFFASLQLGRPIVALFANEMYPLPAEVRESDAYAATFRRISLVWVAYFFAAAAIRLAVLLTASVDVYVVVYTATGAPIIIGLIGWSVRHSVRSLREGLLAPNFGDAGVIAGYPAP
jgi:intracellular septation protein A